MLVFEAVRAQVEASNVMSEDPEKLPPQLPESDIVQLLIAQAESEFEKKSSHVVKESDGVTATPAAPEVKTSSTSVAVPADKLVVQSLLWEIVQLSMTSESAPFVQETQIDLEYPAYIYLLAKISNVEIDISEDQE